MLLKKSKKIEAEGNDKQEKLIIDLWEVRINNQHKGYFDSYEEAREFADNFKTIGQINRIVK